MSGENADMSVTVICECADVEADFERLERLAESVCRRFGTAATVNITVVDDDAIRKLNIEYFKEAAVTDVISFDLSDGRGETADFELIVNADEARRQADERDHSMEAELALYVTHGLLHNLGFDDADAEASSRMHQMEDALLKEAGFGAVYGA